MASKQSGAVQGSSTTNYSYGRSLHLLAVEREGVNYLLIGKHVVETFPLARFGIEDDALAAWPRAGVAGRRVLI